MSFGSRLSLLLWQGHLINLFPFFVSSNSESVYYWEGILPSWADFFFLDARKLAKSPQLLLTCAPSFLSFRGRQEVRALCLFGCGGKSWPSENTLFPPILHQSYKSLGSPWTPKKEQAMSCILLLTFESKKNQTFVCMYRFLILFLQQAAD